jgi:squalene-hopene/tetraprenyl-beta-curcumene cyclase
LNLQNADGGIPTFCRGWTNLPFDRSGADLTAHALQAWHAWRDRLPKKLIARVDRAARRARAYLARVQFADGSWSPLWFGNQFAAEEENRTYGTAKVLIALASTSAALDDTGTRGVDWLLAAQHPDGGWGGATGAPPSVEETALATDALACAALISDGDRRETLRAAVARGCAWLIEHTDGGRRFPPAPIGFYFAKLWYYERDYPLIFTVAALGRAGGLRDKGTERQRD